MQQALPRTNRFWNCTCQPDKSENDVEALSQLLQTIHSGNPFKGTLHIHGLDNASYLLQTWLVSMLEHETVRFPDGRQVRFEGRIAASVFQPLEQVLAQSGIMPALIYKASRRASTAEALT